MILDASEVSDETQFACTQSLDYGIVAETHRYI